MRLEGLKEGLQGEGRVIARQERKEEMDRKLSRRRRRREGEEGVKDNNVKEKESH